MIFHAHPISTSPLASLLIKTLGDGVMLMRDGCKLWFETQGDLWNVDLTPQPKGCAGKLPDSCKHH